VESVNGHKASDENLVQGVRFYQVLTIGLEPLITTALTGLTGPQGPLLFRFAIESMFEPAESEWEPEYQEILKTLERVKGAVSQERDAPSRIITELIHGLRLAYPERAIRVDSNLFACESEPEMVLWEAEEADNNN